MESQENKLLRECRAFDRTGQLLNSSFGYLNTDTGRFEYRDLKDHLTDLGIYLEIHDEENRELKEYYQKLKAIVNKL